MIKTLHLDLNFTEFIKTGKFGFVKLGMSKPELEKNFFPPEDWLNGDTPETSRIWKYGNFELHFDDGLKVSGIFNDYVPEFDGGKSIKIQDWWIFKNGKKAPNLMETIEYLNKRKLDFIKKTNPIGLVSLKLKNQVYMTFEYIGETEGLDHNEFKMVAIGKN